MTIARRLLILSTVPLVALVGLGIFTRLQLSKIEERSRFVAETQVGSLQALGQITRSLGELRVNVRSHLLISDPSGIKTKVVPNCDSVLLLPGLARPEQAIVRRAANAAALSPAAATVGQLAVKRPPSEILLFRTPVRKVVSGMPLPVEGSVPCSGPAFGLMFEPVFSVALN